MERRPDQIVRFTDCRVGLILFGLAEVGLGFLCFCMLALSAWASTLVPAHNPDQHFSFFLYLALLYAATGGTLVTLGVGSGLCRRWARALNLILSWYSLLIGLASTVMMGFFLPRISEFQPTPLDHGTLAIVTTCTLVFMGFFMVALPLAGVLFYGNKNVRATCEERDPQVRWTDRCPLPVLAASVTLVVKSLLILFGAILTHGVMFFFGRLVSGSEGMFFALCICGVWFYAARGLYAMKESAWWILMLTMATWVVCNAIGLSSSDLQEMHRLMGYSAEQVTHLQRYSFLSNGTLSLWSVGYLAPWFGYLVYIKRYLHKPSPFARQELKSTD